MPLRARRAALRQAPRADAGPRRARRSPSATTRTRPRCRCASWARSCPGEGVGGAGGALERRRPGASCRGISRRAAARIAALRQGPHRRTTDQPGLGRHLRRTRAATTTASNTSAASAARPATSRARSARRQSLRRPALARIPDSAAEAAPTAGTLFEQGRAEARLSSRSRTPAAQHVAALHQPVRRADRRMHVLRLLRVVRLRATAPRPARRRRCCRCC